MFTADVGTKRRFAATQHLVAIGAINGPHIRGGIRVMSRTLA